MINKIVPTFLHLGRMLKSKFLGYFCTSGRWFEVERIVLPSLIRSFLMRLHDSFNRIENNYTFKLLSLQGNRIFLFFAITFNFFKYRCAFANEETINCRFQRNHHCHRYHNIDFWLDAESNLTDWPSTDRQDDPRTEYLIFEANPSIRCPECPDFWKTRPLVSNRTTWGENKIFLLNKSDEQHL